jgi:hypothetical protein
LKYIVIPAFVDPADANIFIFHIPPGMTASTGMDVGVMNDATSKSTPLIVRDTLVWAVSMGTSNRFSFNAGAVGEPDISK